MLSTYVRQLLGQLRNNICVFIMCHALKWALEKYKSLPLSSALRLRLELISQGVF